MLNHIEMMTKLAKILPLLLLLLINNGQAMAASILRQVSQTDEAGRMQIFLRFAKLPEYRLENTGKRVDLVVDDTIIGKDFSLLPGDEKMVHMVMRRQPDSLLLSFYFRYPPQRVTVKKINETSSLMVNVLLGNALSAAYPDLATRLGGLTQLHRKEIDYTNPIYATEYGTEWKLFIRNYELPVTIRPQPVYTMPAFPIAASLDSSAGTIETWLGTENLALMKSRNWQALGNRIKEGLENEENEEYRKLLLLSYAECLVRMEEYEEPYKLLQQIALTYPDTDLALGADILFVYVLARHEDPYLATLEVEKLEKRLEAGSLLTASLYIFHAELALETDRWNMADQILKRGDVGYPGHLELVRLLRQADTYYASGDTIKALLAYEKINRRSETMIKDHPLSLSWYGDTLYIHQRYEPAKQFYADLVKQLNGSSLQPLAMFRLAMSRLHNGEKWTRVLPLLSQIQNAFPGNEGDYRARLKACDLKYLHKTITGRMAAHLYAETGLQANKRLLREEALVKQAMVTCLNGEHEQSIKLAMRILREFLHGNLLQETRALIIDQLPTLLKEMIAKKRYIDALVLAKQNRNLFSRGWLGLDLLFDLARAYEELGAYDRAVRVYTYILDVAHEEDQDRAYLPMIRALFKSGQYAKVEDYGDQYFSRFPGSPGIAEVFLLRVKALKQSGELQSAIRLLRQKDRPSSPEIEKTAARIFFEQKLFKDVIALLSSDTLSDWQGGEREYLLAESLFQENEFKKALPVFKRLAEDPDYADQAIFRMATIYRKTGRMQDSLNQFQRLAEKGKEERWRRLAREEVAIIRLGLDRNQTKTD